MHTNHRRKNKQRTRSFRCRCTYCELGKAHAHKRREPAPDYVCEVGALELFKRMLLSVGC